MAEISEKRQVYYIPDNYIGESRIHIGQLSVRVRYLIDSLVIASALGIIAFLLIIFPMKDSALSAKIAVALVICGPGFVAGQIGYNGDPLSTAFSNFLSWRKSNRIRLYNTTPRLLGTDPVKALQEEGSSRDAIVTAYSRLQENIKKRREEGNLVQGQNFEFEYDPGIDDYLEDNGDYADTESNSFDLDIDAGSDLSGIKLAYSRDGYNEEPDEETFNLSDYETN